MSRQNKPREIFAEIHVAERIAAERDARGWTNDGLAQRMTDVGCPMVGSAIFKIEKAEPRRRIVVDELVAFARVFSVSVEELLLPPEVVASKEFQRLVKVYLRARQKAAPLIEAERIAAEQMTSYRSAHRPDLQLAVQRANVQQGIGHPYLTQEMVDILAQIVAEAGTI